MEKSKTEKVTRPDYCQYLSVSQTNCTLTDFAGHCERFSHDTINRYLSGDKITPDSVWENVKGQIIQTPDGYVISDDTVTDKNYPHKIGMVRRRYSGNAHGIIRGPGVVTCVYVNPVIDRFRVTDYRISDPDGDGKTRPDHVKDMSGSCIYRQLQFFRVLTDTWYAAKTLMLYIGNLKKLYYCPIRYNRLVDDSGNIRQDLRKNHFNLRRFKLMFQISRQQTMPDLINRSVCLISNFSETYPNRHRTSDMVSHNTGFPTPASSDSCKLFSLTVKLLNFPTYAAQLMSGLFNSEKA